MYTLTKETLNLLENRMLKSMLGELDDDLPAATLEIFRKVLRDNGRLTETLKHFEGDDLKDDEAVTTDLPFPRLVPGGK